jgi:hypothetical protein
MPKGELLTYLKEACRTYAMGFFIASVALARSAVEAAVRPGVGRFLGASATTALDLKDLIERNPLLDKPSRALAHRVRIIGNRAIHDGKPPSADEAFEVVEATRSLIAYLAGK